MDMKKILQALDGVAERKVEGTNDMRKFLSIVAKEPVKQKLSESVITSFDEDTIGGDANSFLIAADNINDLVMGNIDKIKINADEQLLKELMSKFNEFMSAYHAVGKEILQPDMFDDVQVEEKQEGISNGLAFKDYFALEESKSKIREGVAGPKNCWPGYRKTGTQPGTGKNKGKRVNDCEKIKEDEVEEGVLDTVKSIGSKAVGTVAGAATGVKKFFHKTAQHAVDEYMKAKYPGKVADTPQKKDAALGMYLLDKGVLDRADLDKLKPILAQAGTGLFELSMDLKIDFNQANAGGRLLNVIYPKGMTKKDANGNISSFMIGKK